MPSATRAVLESLLQSKKLDRTLTTAIRRDVESAFTGVPAVDTALAGGFPRGELSELAGPRSSGRTTVLLHTLAAATARGELVALVDALDMLDVDSAAAAGVDLRRLLWIRGHVVSNPGLCRDLNQRAMEQAVKALGLVLQAGNFGVVALDVAEAPADAIRRLPFTTWLRLQRMVEGSQTACVIVGSAAVARSSAGVTVRTGMTQGSRIGDPGSGIRDQPSGIGARFTPRLFAGLDVTVGVVRARARVPENISASFSTAAAHA